MLIAGIAAIVFVVILGFGGFVQNLFGDTCDDTSQTLAAHGQPSNC